VSYLPQEYPSTAALTVFEAVLVARQQSASWMVDDAGGAKAAMLRQVYGVEARLPYLRSAGGATSWLRGRPIRAVVPPST
jgi:ABC-type cobalamin/Fe3+-siderophores transport system ATPase subunit